MTSWTIDEAVDFASRYEHIALDVDGVLASFVDCFRMTYHDISDSAWFEVSQITQWDIGKSLQLDPDLEDRVWKSERLLEHMRYAPVIISGKRFVDGIENYGVKITYITARGIDDLTSGSNDFHMELLKNWLELNEFPSGDIYLEGNKIERMKELGIQLLVDDSGGTAMKGIEDGVDILLPDWPWNRHVEHERIKRVSW